MDFRLQVFITSAKELSYSSCAKILGISQPAVSKHIKELEKEYGIELFERSGNKIRLTYEGEIFLDKAKRINALYRNLKDEGTLISKAPKGRFSIVLPPPIYYGFFPAFVGEFCHLSPNSSLEVQISSNTEDKVHKLTDSSGKNEIILSFDSKNSNSPELLFSDTLIVAGGAGFNSDNYYDLQELKFLNYSNDSQTERDIIEFFNNSQNDYSNLHTIAHLEDSQAIIRLLLSYQKYANRAPLAVAFLWKSQISKFLKDGKLKIVNISEFQDYTMPKRFYNIAYTNNSATQGFVDFFRNWIKNVI